MLQSTVSRIRFSLGALGCAALAASLFNWAQARYTAPHQYTWAEVNSADAARAETAEIWQVSANCARPYFVRALLRSKAKLKAYYDLAPPEVRARLDRSSAIAQSQQPAGWYHLVKSASDVGPHSSRNTEYVAQLHVQYAEWYANVFKLEIEESRWQQRLTDVADQRLIVSEDARKSFGAYSSGDARATGAAAGGFDDQVLATLGLGGFPSDEEQALRSDCVKVDLVKRIFENPKDLWAIWRWPVEQTGAFGLGLELILIGVFLVPITLWLGTGDPQLAARHIRVGAGRFAARARYVASKKFIADGLTKLHAASIRTRTFLARLGARLGPPAHRQAELLLRMASAVPNTAVTPAVWERWVRPRKHDATSPPRRPAECRRPS